MLPFSHSDNETEHVSVGEQMSSTNQTVPISGAQLESSERYQVLTERQKVFVTDYLANGDAVVSVQRAFRCKDEKTAKVMSYQVLQHPKVADCLAEFQGKSELEIQIEGARRDVLKAPDYEKTNARRLLCELTGLLTPSNRSKVRSIDSQADEADEPEAEDSQPRAEASPARFKVGDICIQSGQKFRVTAVDKDGQPVAADEGE